MGDFPNKDTQFKAGQSGNPEGMKKGFVSFKKTIRELAEKTVTYKDLDDKELQTTAGQALVTALMGKAIYKQDTQAAKILMEHVEGVSVNVSKESDEDLDQRILELLDKGGEAGVSESSGGEEAKGDKE